MNKPINLELFTKAEVVDLIKQYYRTHPTGTKIPAFPGLAQRYFAEHGADEFYYYGTRICRIGYMGEVHVYE